MKCGGSQSLILSIFPQVFRNRLVLLNDILSLNVSFIDIIPVFLLSMLQYWIIVSHILHSWSKFTPKLSVVVMINHSRNSSK